jgi:hypothetical protein
VTELLVQIPDVNVLLCLDSEELAAKTLFILRQRRSESQHRGSIGDERWSASPGSPSPCPARRQVGVKLALAEARASLPS